MREVEHFSYMIISIVLLFLAHLLIFCSALSISTRQNLKMRILSTDAELKEVFSRPKTTIIGFGSLLSETSSRYTFPNLQNFREVRIEGYTRKYQHPAFVFFRRGIADLDTKAYASLSTEPSADGGGFIACAFEIEGETKEAWVNREEEFEFHMVNFREKGGEESTGIMCCAPRERDDAIFISRFGEETYNSSLKEAGISGIWNRELNQGILPCSVYLRHCVLASRRSRECEDSFLDETFLENGVPVRQYLAENPWVMELQPPQSLVGRYSG